MAFSAKENHRKGWKYIYKCNKLILNVWYPIIAKKCKHSGVDEGHEMIVSLTTFQERIDKVWITIASMMNQTYKPKKIILWLAEEQFPDKENGLPNSLLKLKNRGLEIRFCDNLISHKKYFYTMKEYPNDYIVTVDDDIFYPEDHLEKLWNTHLRYDKAVCCHYAHLITYEHEKIAPYANWKGSYEKGTTPNFQIMPIGCGGVLYPPASLHPDLFEKEKIKTLCPQMDDLWLKSMEILNHTKAVKCEEGSLIYFGILGTKKSGLQHSNAGQGRNDIAMKAIMEEYPQIEEFLFKDFVEGRKC